MTKLLTGHRESVLGSPTMDLTIREDDGYRTCVECGADCQPDPFDSGQGIRVAFVCSGCGLHSVVDPFEHLR